MFETELSMIGQRWPARFPDRIQLYSAPTPNGAKISIALEEMELSYEGHFISLAEDETRTDAFLALNPNGKLPVIVDPHGPMGKPLVLSESGAILLYLAEKTGRLIPEEPDRRLVTIQWVFFQMASVGPMFGQVGYFNKFAGRAIEDKRPLARYAAESKRLLGVLDQRLVGRRWIMGDLFSIADIAMIGWVRNITGLYEAGELVDFDALSEVPRWRADVLARPAVQRGFQMPAPAPTPIAG